jgi:hypothetical protein
MATTTRILAAAGALTLAALATGCSSGADVHASSGENASAVAAHDVAALPAQAASGGPVGGPGANRPPMQARAVISTGQVSLVARDVDQARDRIDRLLNRYGGVLSKEQTSSDAQGRTRSATLELRVPATAFYPVLHSFADFATVRSSESDSQDVTTQVIDVDARVHSQRDGLRKLRAFLRQATDIDAMIQIESDIASREADLESMLAQQRYLDDQTAMSTITVDLTRAARSATPGAEHHDLGFLAGLRGGWDAFAGAVVVVLTGVGAVLPFGLALTLVGLPLWLLARTIRRRAGGTRPVPPAADS